MKPIIKYQGGKTKELSIIRNYIGKNHKRIVEPFCGGAAVSFDAEIPAVLNDINKDVINLYQSVANYKTYVLIQEKVDLLKDMDHDALELEYYAAREAINQPWECVDPCQRALSYIIVRQLCFSGMERYNAKGEFNVPFGHYKKFSCNLSHNHHLFLKQCDIRFGDAISLFDSIQDNDFVFVDPPYLDRLGYTTGDGGAKLHVNLADVLHNCNADWLLIHCDDDFYREEYSTYTIVDKDFNYSQRWGKNKDHSNSKVNHLYISNVPVAQLSTTTVTAFLEAV